MTKKRLLVLMPRFPYPPIGGDRIRILRICRGLSAYFDITLLSLCESKEEMSFEPKDGVFAAIHRIHLPRWKSYVRAGLAIPSSRPLQLAYYKSAEFRRAVDELLPQHDLVLAHLIRTGQYIEELPILKIMDMTDAISMNYQRVTELCAGFSWKKLIYKVEQRRLHEYELSTVSKFDRVWLTSQGDRSFLDPSHDLDIDVIPTGVDAELFPFRPPVADANVIVFIGNMVTLQNQDACHYFIEEILPMIRSEAEVQFRIVGSATERVQRSFRGYAGVEMTGRLDRIQDGVKGAFCGVCPVRAGAGIQTKILEYLAMGLPCVTSPIGLGGVRAEPGREVMLYRDAGEAATQILKLYRDARLRNRIAAAGRELVCRRYDWQRVQQDIVDSCFKVMGMPARPEGEGDARDVSNFINDAVSFGDAEQDGNCGSFAVAGKVH